MIDAHGHSGVAGARAPSRCRPRPASPRAVRRRPGSRRPALARGGRDPCRSLEAPGHAGDDPSPPRPRRRAGGRRAARRDVPRRARQHDRGSTRSARRAADAPRAFARRRRAGRRARRPRGARPDGGARASAFAPAIGVDTPASGSAPSSTSGSAAPTSGRRWRTRALRAYSQRDITMRFVSNVDATDVVEALRDLDPATTLAIVSSKTFTTVETMTNARTVRQWLLDGLGGDEAAIARHVVAVSTNLDAVASSGSTRRTRSASGTGSAAGTRWTPRSASRR